MEVSDMDTSSSKRTFTVTYDYHLTHDKEMREIVPYHGYNHVSLGFYAFNVAEGS